MMQLREFDRSVARVGNVNCNILLAVCVLLLPIGCGCAQLANWSGERGRTSENTNHQNLDIQFGLARRAERNGSLSEARKLYLNILETEPNHAPTLHRMGVVSVKLEDPHNALEFFRRAISQAVPSAELLGDLGYAQFLNGNSKLATETLSRALKDDPNNRRIVNNLALVLGSQGQTNECLKLFRRVNSEAEALNNTGFVLSQIGAHDQALHFYHEALDREPSLKKAGNGLASLHQFQMMHEAPFSDEPERMDHPPIKAVTVGSRRE